MSKITKKQLARKIEALEKFADYADNMLTQLNHALPELLDIKHWRDEQADHDELMEVLDSSKEQKLKQLDHSVFDGLDGKWRFAAVDLDGESWVYREQPKIDKGDDRWSASNTPPNSIGTGYDTSNWQNSLIERDIAKELLEVDLSSELTGSDLCRAMLARGEKYVMCRVNDDNNIQVIGGWTEHGFTSRTNEFCLFGNPIPINNQGEPLTAADVGL